MICCLFFFLSSENRLWHHFMQIFSLGVAWKVARKVKNSIFLLILSNVSPDKSLFTHNNGRGCRVAWVMVAQVARWGRLCPWVGVSCLMPAVAPSHGMVQLMCVRRGMYFAGRVLPVTYFVFQLLGFSDTDEDKIRKRISRTKFGIITPK